MTRGQVYHLSKTSHSVPPRGEWPITYAQVNHRLREFSFQRVSAKPSMGSGRGIHLEVLNPDSRRWREQESRGKGLTPSET